MKRQYATGKEDSLVTEWRARNVAAMGLMSVLLAGFVGVVVLNAWLSDDAYITFRTIDNFVHGYGLTWNTAERVQSYTHPLWMLLLSGFSAITREIYFTSLAISILMSFGAVLLVVLSQRRSVRLAALAVVVFSLSKAFVDYATSGLENPLTHLLLAIFVLIYLGGPVTPRRFFWISLVAALGMLNRLDTTLLFAPALVYALLESRSWRSALYGMLGALPLVLWQVFALFYYGALVPNTAIAKLNTGLIPPAEIWREGLFYLENSLRVDPITLLVIGLGFVLPLVMRDWRKLPLVFGSGLYLVYVVRVGGDFMSGRFLTATLFMAVMVIVHLPWPSFLPRAHLPDWTMEAALLATVVVVGSSAPYNPIRAWGSTSAHHDAGVWVRGRSITDERPTYYGNTSLVRALGRGARLPDHDWAEAGRKAREAGPSVVLQGSVGFFGYFAGPEVHVVDLLGLGDPLLARLPVTDPNWQIGHFGRRLPEGYIESLAQGQNHIADPNLARFYDHLATVTRGDLWDPLRWREVWALMLGRYDAWLDAYAFHRDDPFSPRLSATNPTDHPYVYTYVWNNGAGEMYLLDDASERGKVYLIEWFISPSGVRFAGDYRQHVSSIGSLSDEELLTVGVIFAPDALLRSYEMYEHRYWFGYDGPAATTFTIVLPGLAWYNGEAPGGFWQECPLDTVLSLVPSP
jgi:arabinofuranosyltransferase